MTLAAIETGGTKTRVALAAADGSLGEQLRVPTTTGEETIAAVLDFLSAQPPVEAVGIAAFGPLVVDRASENYGAMAKTPKPGWSGFPLLGTVANALGVRADLQTDVEAAAVAEHRLGAGRGADSVAYVTVGTGIGAGVLVDGAPFRGRDHLEIGHIPVQRHPDDTFPGLCPFHQDCLEGMATGLAVGARWDVDPETLPPEHEAWQLEAWYLAQLATVITLAFSVDRILFSGGVGARESLTAKIAAATQERLNGYSVSQSDNANLVGRAALGNDAGLVGAALLAEATRSS